MIPAQNTNDTVGGSGPTGESLIDPQTLMRIKNLEWRARAVVEGFLNGIHRSPFHGFSVEFSEYRQYTPGDDPRYLDWKLYARTDRYFVKRFEDETNLRCHLVLDLSRSMSFGSIGYEKREYAATLAATVAYFLTTQRDSVGLLTFSDRIEQYVPSRYRPGHLHHICVCLEKPVAGEGTDVNGPLEQIAQTVKKRGLIVIASDFLADIDQLEKNLGYLRSRGHEVVVFQLLDPAEKDFSFSDPTMFRDLETGRNLYVDPNTAGPEYRRLLGEHIEQLSSICAELGVDFCPFTTDQPLEMALFDFLQARTRRATMSRRNRQRHSSWGAK